LPNGNGLLRAATVPGCVLQPPVDGLTRRDLRLAAGRIMEVGTLLPGDGVNLDGGMVLPGFVDLHTHLDKGHTWPRAPNPDGTLRAALAAARADQTKNWSEQDVAERFEFALRCAYAHGTIAIRTHLDSGAPEHAMIWLLFQRLRAQWAGRIELQAASLLTLQRYAGPAGEVLADLVAESGGLLGGAAQSEPDGPALLQRLFDLAVSRNLDIDLHVDETGDPGSRILHLVAEETIRRGWQGRVTCGHCCSLAVQPDEEASRTIALVAEAQITVVSLPIVNQYLQDRGAARTPRWRGITLLHELRAAGVPVALGSDNTRDPFHIAGDLDMVEVFREAVRIGHLDVPVGDWPLAVGSIPAAAMRLPSGRLMAGAAADLVVFSARNWSEWLSRPQSDRVVLRGGHPIDTTPPDYRELDHLFTDG
jgi:cytosine deaminase